METCGFRFTTYIENTTAIFEELTIIGAVPTPAVDQGLDANDSTFFPVSSQVSIMPLEPEDYEYSFVVQEDVTTHILTLINTDAELYSFGLWGRVFATDGLDADPPVSEDSAGNASTCILSSVLLVLAIAVIRF